MTIVDKKGFSFFTIIGLTALGIAQLGSYLVETNLQRGESVQITSFFYLTHVRNLGGIFGIMQGEGWLFAIVSVIFLGALTVFAMVWHDIKRYEYFFYGLIVGGGLSNVVDRLIYGSVIDFIDIRGIPHWYYVFNTADLTIHLGVWPLIIMSFFDKKTKKVNTEETAAGGS